MCTRVRSRALPGLPRLRLVCGSASGTTHPPAAAGARRDAWCCGFWWLSVFSGAQLHGGLAFCPRMRGTSVYVGASSGAMVRACLCACVPVRALANSRGFCGCLWCVARDVGCPPTSSSRGAPQCIAPRCVVALALWWVASGWVRRTCAFVRAFASACAFARARSLLRLPQPLLVTWSTGLTGHPPAAAEARRKAWCPVVWV